MSDVVAIVLAAGLGRRMGGRPKALLRFPAGPTFLEAIVATCAAAGVERVVVVLASAPEGAAKAVLDATVPPGATIARNPAPERGMISSIHVGLRSEAAQGVAGALVWPVDCPRVPASVVRQLIETVARTHAPLVIPRHGRRRGHPALFAASLFDELLAVPIDGDGARAVVRSHQGEMVTIDVDAAEVLDDFDTLADLCGIAAPG